MAWRELGESGSGIYIYKSRLWHLVEVNIKRNKRNVIIFSYHTFIHHFLMLKENVCFSPVFNIIKRRHRKQINMHLITLCLISDLDGTLK